MRDRKRQPSAPSREEPPEVEQLRKQVEYLRALVHTDELTGLSNLRHFNETLSLELERTRRSKQPSCLILLDLDNFKAVNDDHGHEVGNSVLCHFAKVIRQTIRRLDTPCRLGGDEFAIILPATNLEQGT
ncbi:MAG: GGDEF domain-containing protein, partial [Gammaproteobacteria bacterium]|nr:GGDEF domain-containing protein [Gammaproteobacteria bacterium]